MSDITIQCPNCKATHSLNKRKPGPKSPWRYCPAVCPSPGCNAILPEAWFRARHPTSRSPKQFVIPSKRQNAILGQGGVGIVFRSSQPVTDQPWALKLQWVKRTPGVTERDALLEARTMAGLQHPNCVRVHQAGRIPYGRRQGHHDDGFLVWIGMELMTGTTLHERLWNPDSGRGIDQLSPEDALEAMLHMLSGLEALHGLDMAHRDIKPANVFVPARGPVTNRSEVKLGDFGLVHRFTAPGEGWRTTGGTEGYTDPVQRDAQLWDKPPHADPPFSKPPPISPRMDIYAAGKILEEVLDKVDGLDHLGEVVKRCTGRPGARPPTAKTLRRELQAYLETEYPGTFYIKDAAGTHLTETHASLELRRGRALPDLNMSGQLQLHSMKIRCEIIPRHLHVQDLRSIYQLRSAEYKVDIDTTIDRSQIYSSTLVLEHETAGTGARRLGELRGTPGIVLNVMLWMHPDVQVGPYIPLHPQVIPQFGPPSPDQIILGRDFVDSIGVARTGGHWILFCRIDPFQPTAPSTGGTGPQGAAGVSGSATGIKPGLAAHRSAQPRS